MTVFFVTVFVFFVTVFVLFVTVSLFAMFPSVFLSRSTATTTSLLALLSHAFNSFHHPKVLLIKETMNKNNAYLLILPIYNFYFIFTFDSSVSSSAAKERAIRASSVAFSAHPCNKSSNIFVNIKNSRGPSLILLYYVYSKSFHSAYHCFRWSALLICNSIWDIIKWTMDYSFKYYLIIV